MQDGAVAALIFAQKGYWRPTKDSTTFLSCASGYKGNNAEKKKLAEARCCPAIDESATQNNTNTSSPINASNTTTASSPYSECYAYASKMGRQNRSNATSRNDTETWDRDHQCVDPFTGILCMVCNKTTHVRINDTCVECDGGARVELIGYALCVLMAVLFLVCTIILFLTEKASSNDTHDAGGSLILDLVAIMISWMQIFSAITVTYDSVSWPDSFTDYSLSLGIINLDINFVMPAVDCHLAIPFLDKFALHMATPIAVVLTVGASKLAATALTVLTWHPKTKGQRRGNRWRLTKGPREAQNAYAYKIVLNILLLLYPSLTTRLFQVFRCTNIDVLNESVLMLDYSVICWEEGHWPYVIVAGCCIFVYAIGMPMFLLYELWSHRSELHVYVEDMESGKVDDKGDMARFRLSNFYQSYEPSFWYWECVLLVYKCFMAGVLCVCRNGSPTQLLIAILVCIGYMLFCLKAGPYESDSADVLSFLASISMVLTLLTGYSKITYDQAVAPYDVKEWGYEFTEEVLGTTLLVINTIPPLYFTLAVLNILRQNAGGAKKAAAFARAYTRYLCCRVFCCRKTTRPVFRVDKTKRLTRVRSRKNQALIAQHQLDAHNKRKNAAVKIVPTGRPRASAENGKNRNMQMDPLPHALTGTFYSGRRGTELLDTMTHHMATHEGHLNRTITRKQNKSRRTTQLRVLARQRLRQSKALSKVDAFRHLGEDAMSTVIDAMIYQQKRQGDVLCNQGDSADRLYVVIKGQCAVSSCAPSSTREIRVGSVHELEVFGESALFEQDAERIRNATVSVESERVQLLVLKRDKYAELVASGVLDHTQFVTRVRSSRSQESDRAKGRGIPIKVTDLTTSGKGETDGDTPGREGGMGSVLDRRRERMAALKTPHQQYSMIHADEDSSDSSDDTVGVKVHDPDDKGGKNGDGCEDTDDETHALHKAKYLKLRSTTGGRVCLETCIASIAKEAAPILGATWDKSVVFSGAGAEVKDPMNTTLHEYAKLCKLADKATKSMEQLAESFRAIGCDEKGQCSVESVAKAFVGMRVEERGESLGVGDSLQMRVAATSKIVPFDTDQDGHISFAEYAKFIEASKRAEEETKRLQKHKRMSQKAAAATELAKRRSKSQWRQKSRRNKAEGKGGPGTPNVSPLVAVVGPGIRIKVSVKKLHDETEVKDFSKEPGAGVAGETSSAAPKKTLQPERDAEASKGSENAAAATAAAADDDDDMIIKKSQSGKWL